MTESDRIVVGAFPDDQICDDATFDSTLANTRAGFLKPDSMKDQIRRPADVHTVVGAYMAGMRCPSADRLIQVTHNPDDLEHWEKGAINELFEQLTPQECFEFMVSTDCSPRELANLLRACAVRRAIVVNWINQFSSDPNWRKDEALSIIEGERDHAAATVIRHQSKKFFGIIEEALLTLILMTPYLSEKKLINDLRDYCKPMFQTVVCYDINEETDTYIGLNSHNNTN